MPPEKTMEGMKGEKSRELKVYDVEQRRLIDAEITRRSVAFIERQGKAVIARQQEMVTRPPRLSERPGVLGESGGDEERPSYRRQPGSEENQLGRAVCHADVGRRDPVAARQGRCKLSAVAVRVMDQPVERRRHRLSHAGRGA